jgi:DNA-binding SARP family transcriptional activator
MDVLDRAKREAALNPQSAALWLAQATAEYQSLAASLSALRTQLAAMGVNFEPAHEPGKAVTSPANGAPMQAPAAVDDEASVRVNLLGPFQIEVADRKLGPGVPGQVRTVLEYLVSQGRRPTPKDAILDLLWPDADPNVANGRLRVVMHALRKSIPFRDFGIEELIVTSGNNFMLNPQVKLWIDVAQFERHWQNGWRLHRAGRDAEALAEYERAEALYVGDFLEDEPYADWTLLRREALRDAYASILTVLANKSLQASDFTGCIIWAQKLLAQDDCREDAYRLLITSHRALGQSSRASYWYGHCARTLKRELGVEPSPETEALLVGTLPSSL